MKNLCKACDLFQCERGCEVTSLSVKDAAAAVRVAASRITYACRTGTKCATFYWRYADE